MMKLGQMSRFLVAAAWVIGIGCSQSIQVDPKSMAATQLALAKAQIAAGNAAMARAYLSNTLAFDPTSEEAKALLATLPPAPTALPAAAFTEILRKNAVDMVAMARTMAKNGQTEAAKGYVEAALKMAPGLPEAEALAGELGGGAKVASLAAPTNDAGSVASSIAAAPIEVPTEPSGCPSVKGSELVGATKAQVIASWGPPVEVAPFSLADARFIFGGLATAKESLTQLRYEDGAGITFVMVGKDNVVVAIYWDPNRTGKFASAPLISGGPYAGLVGAVDKTWLVIPYVSNDGYATVGSSAACGPGLVIIGAHCPLGESLDSCGQGRLIYFTTRGFALPPEAKTRQKMLPLKDTDVEALPQWSEIRHGQPQLAVADDAALESGRDDLGASCADDDRVLRARTVHHGERQSSTVEGREFDVVVDRQSCRAHRYDAR